LINVAVIVLGVSGERLLDPDKPIEGHVQITTNITVSDVEFKENSLRVRFVFTASYMPAIATITIKGMARVLGASEDLNRIYNEHLNKKPLPLPILQAISNAAFTEAVIVARSLGVPPPVPLPVLGAPPGEAKKTQPGYIA